jgi:hypothetical protein
MLCAVIWLTGASVLYSTLPVKLSSMYMLDVPLRSFLNFTPLRLYRCTLPLGELPVTVTVMWYMPASPVSGWLSSLLHEAINKQTTINKN